MANNKRTYILPRMEVITLKRSEACLLGCSNGNCEDSKDIFDDIGMTPFDNPKRG